MSFINIIVWLRMSIVRVVNIRFCFLVVKENMWMVFVKEEEYVFFGKNDYFSETSMFIRNDFF